MERAKGAQTPYEVYCYHCRVTFPREARHCIHCGGRLGPPGRAAQLETMVPRPAAKRRADPAAVAAAEAAAEEAEESGSMLVRRFGGLAVWAVLALAAVLSNLCQGRG